MGARRPRAVTRRPSLSNPWSVLDTIGALCREPLVVALMRPHRFFDFYRSCGLIHVEGSYCFVHAGIRPGVELNEQRNQDLLWIREDFTGSQAVHDHVVVHGHTITPEVEWLPNRIGIDTGAFHTGVLTCLVLEGEEQRLLQTG